MTASQFQQIHDFLFGIMILQVVGFILTASVGMAVIHFCRRRRG